MSIYSEKIALNEWKDYSISFQTNYALFCIHKSFNINPSYKILKVSNKLPIFSLLSEKNILKKSKSLRELLNYFKKPNLRLVR